MKLKELVLSTKTFRERQYQSGKVLAIKFRYIPRSKQLYVYSYVESGTEKGKKYKVLLVFNQIQSAPERSKNNNMKLEQDEELFYLSRPTFNSNVLVRCNDPSFRHEFHWYDAKYKALIGPKIPYKRVPGSNRPPKNMKQIPGICKHIIQVILKLLTVKVLTDKDPQVIKYITQKRLPTR